MSILLLYLAACKKKEEILPENKTQNSTNNIQNARAYFYAKQAQALAMRQQNSSSSKTNGTIFESTEFNSFAPAWDSTQTFTAQNGNTVLLSPVFRNITISYQANIYYIRRLRTELNPQGIVLKSTIIELITKQAAIAEQKYAILTEPQNYPNTSEYTIYEYDLAYNLTNERCVNCEENEQSGPPPLLPIDMCRYETDICGVILISYEPC
ncbi:MAG: hypothetical protein SFU27_14545, partial [Thermonemataceae bacterium]|nr:hypothetical protein [Thermonemataceae bacterium]